MTTETNAFELPLPGAMAHSIPRGAPVTGGFTCYALPKTKLPNIFTTVTS